MRASSAKRRMQEGDLICLGRSLMKRRKRRGTRTDPWGTPEVTGVGCDEDPFMTTEKVLSSSHDWIHRVMRGWRPKVPSL